MLRDCRSLVSIPGRLFILFSIGSPDRLSYLLVGDTVNLASRLQSLTRSMDARIIISADTVASLPAHLIQEKVLKHSQSVRVKGRKVEIDVYLIA